MYGIERKSEILDILEAEGKVDVSKLAARLGASKETIRRDLRKLEEKGALKRTHGGAVMSDIIKSEYPVCVRGIKQVLEKRDLCKKAAEFINDKDIIFIDNSSTCRYLAEYIDPSKKVTILTNSINLMLEASKTPCENHTYISLGGMLNSSNLSLHGNMALKNAEGYYPAKVFLSCAGINAQKGIITDGSINEVETKKLMIDHGGEVFILADHTKWEKKGQVFLTAIPNADKILTDKKTDIKYAKALSAEKAQVVYA